MRFYLFLFSFVLYCNALLARQIPKDILEITRFNINDASNIVFDKNGKFFIQYKPNTDSLILWNLKKIKPELGVILEVDETNKQNIGLILNNNSTILLVKFKTKCLLFTVDSLKFLYQYDIPEDSELTFSSNNADIFISNNKDVFYKLNIISRELKNYILPQQFNYNPYATRIRNVIPIPNNDSLVYLLDVGHANENAEFKFGYHINLILYNVYLETTEKFIPINLDYTRSLSYKDVFAFYLNVMQNYFLISAAGELIFFDLKQQTKRRLLLGENFKYIDCHKNKYYIAFGFSASVLFEFVAKKNLVLPLKRFLGGANCGVFSHNSKYIITPSVIDRTLIFWDIVNAMSIRTKPTQYVKFSTNKQTQIHLKEWKKRKATETKKMFEKRLADISLITATEYALLKKNFHTFANEVFKVGEDYVTVEGNGLQSKTLIFNTEGFESVMFAIEDTLILKKAIAALMAGHYKWKNLAFDITSVKQDKLIIDEGMLVITGVGSFVYKRKENDIREINKMKREIINMNSLDPIYELYGKPYDENDENNRRIEND